jgi:hypothetical protein
MYSDCAPDRNPAEISYAAVDRRLTHAQRKEILDVASYYNVRSYYVEISSVCLIGEDGYSICYVEKNGNVIPMWN